MHCIPYMVSICHCFLYVASICPCFLMGMPLLWAALDSPLSQGPLLWCHNNMTVIVSRNTRGCERDPDNALTTRMHGDYRVSIVIVVFNAICETFLWNNPIYIKGRNCMLSTVPGLLKKMLGPPWTPYQVGGLAGDVMRAWVSHS